MDDFSLTSLYESKNIFTRKLVNLLTPQIFEGINSIYHEAIIACQSTKEEEKYLMTFQNYLTRVPKWNQAMIEQEIQRIIEKAECPFLEDLITCVHITHLKALSAARVGTKQKKIDIDIPKLPIFIHNIYNRVARIMYKNIYLFEKVNSLKFQKNMHMVENLISKTILDVVADDIPIVYAIFKNYYEETEEVLEESRTKLIEEKENLINDDAFGKANDISNELNFSSLPQNNSQSINVTKSNESFLGDQSSSSTMTTKDNKPYKVSIDDNSFEPKSPITSVPIPGSTGGQTLIVVPSTPAPSIDDLIKPSAINALKAMKEEKNQQMINSSPSITNPSPTSPTIINISTSSPIPQKEKENEIDLYSSSSISLVNQTPSLSLQNPDTMSDSESKNFIVDVVSPLSTSSTNEFSNYGNISPSTQQISFPDETDNEKIQIGDNVDMVVEELPF